MAPCGACRQFAAEFRPDLPILLVDADHPSGFSKRISPSYSPANSICGRIARVCKFPTNHPLSFSRSARLDPGPRQLPRRPCCPRRRWPGDFTLPRHCWGCSSLLPGARETIGLRGQSLAGICFFFGIVALFSTNLRAVNWRTIGWGIALQLLLALLVLQGKVTVGGRDVLGLRVV